MSLFSVAKTSVTAERVKLSLGISERYDSDKAMRAATGQGGGVEFTDALANYSERMKALSAKCIAQREWINKHATLPGWIVSGRWESHATSEMQMLYLDCLNHVTGIYQRSRVADGWLMQDVNRRLEKTKTAICVEMEVALAALHEEAKSTTHKTGLSAFQKYVLPSITEAVGIGIGALWHQISQWHNILGQ